MEKATTDSGRVKIGNRTPVFPERPESKPESKIDTKDIGLVKIGNRRPLFPE